MYTEVSHCLFLVNDMVMGVGKYSNGFWVRAILRLKTSLIPPKLPSRFVYMTVIMGNDVI